MSDKTIFLRFLEEVYRSSERMIQKLLEKPSCVEGLPEKKDVYNIAIQYFKRKDERTKSRFEEEDDINNAHVIKFEMMLENYTYASYKLKKEYAINIALYILQTSEGILKNIPQDLKDEAFGIIYRYLEQQMDSQTKTGAQCLGFSYMKLFRNLPSVPFPPTK